MLRTILSLLGVTVGIFAIIAVFTVVDSLEREIRKSLNFIGENVIYVQKWPWVFENDFPWWKYYNRPVANVSDYKFLQKNLQNASVVSIFADKGNRTIRYKSSSMDGLTIMGVSQEYNLLSDVPLGSGRWFTDAETEAGRNVCIIGYEVAAGLFPNEDPIGKAISSGRGNFRATIIGVMAKQGANFLGAPTKDNIIYIPYSVFVRRFNVRWIEPMIGIKGFPKDVGLQTVEGETIGLMRSKRGLKPSQPDNFAINRPEMIANQIGQIFVVLGLAGGIIGSFSILVGGFGIANIMFVSVKERTNLIGIQKSLGAKNWFILFQFLFEAIFLSLLGGMAGLLLVWLGTFVHFDAIDIEISAGNVITGIVVSAVIGIISGIVPAWIASRMDPVEAIRSK